MSENKDIILLWEKVSQFSDSEKTILEDNIILEAFIKENRSDDSSQQDTFDTDTNTKNEIDDKESVRVNQCNKQAIKLTRIHIDSRTLQAGLKYKILISNLTMKECTSSQNADLESVYLCKFDRLQRSFLIVNRVPNSSERQLIRCDIDDEKKVLVSSKLVRQRDEFIALFQLSTLNSHLNQLMFLVLEGKQVSLYIYFEYIHKTQKLATSAYTSDSMIKLSKLSSAKKTLLIVTDKFTFFFDIDNLRPTANISEKRCVLMFSGEPICIDIIDHMSSISDLNSENTKARRQISILDVESFPPIPTQTREDKFIASLVYVSKTNNLVWMAVENSNYDYKGHKLAMLDLSDVIRQGDVVQEIFVFDALNIVLVAYTRQLEGSDVEVLSHYFRLEWPEKTTYDGKLIHIDTSSVVLPKPQKINGSGKQIFIRAQQLKGLPLISMMIFTCELATVANIVFSYDSKKSLITPLRVLFDSALGTEAKNNNETDTGIVLQQLVDQYPLDDEMVYLFKTSTGKPLTLTLDLLCKPKFHSIPKQKMIKTLVLHNSLTIKN